MSSPDWLIAIDFGTSTSKVAAAPVDPSDRLARIRPLALGRDGGGANPFLTPGAVFVDGDSIHLGNAALEAAIACAEPGREALQSFKLLLAAGDIEDALRQMAPRQVDPARALRYRDLIILYLAHLLSLARAAAASDPDLAGLEAPPIRYARPAWRGGGVRITHPTTSRLFDEASLVESALGELLHAPGGVGRARAQDALAAAAAASVPRSRVTGAMLEAMAAASCHLGPREPAWRHMLVLDVGAGTTDLGALALGAGVDGAAEEIVSARQTLLLAGDQIDRLLMNLVIEKARGKSIAERSAQWRSMLPVVRAGKEALFATRKAAFRVGQQVVSIELAALERDADFKALTRSTEAAYRASLDATAQRAAQDGARAVGVVLAGGGCEAPFVRKIVATVQPKIGRVRAATLPTAPAWVDAERFDGNLVGVFRQLSIALGAALAPDELLSAGGGEGAP